MKFVSSLLLAATALTFIGCTSMKPEHHSMKKAPSEKEVLTNYADIVHASYEDSLMEAQKLEAALEQLVQDPSPATLEFAKSAWKQTRIPYGQTEVYRFGEGPIDDEDGPEGQLNAWPMDEGYVDYVVGDSQGLIQSMDFDITKSNLIEVNEAGGEENVSTGFHAIEFLLWGQDQDPNGPGSRPYTDFAIEESDSVESRRALYLLTVAQLLNDDLESLVNAWAPGDAENYRAEFLALPTKEALRRILTGMGTLSKAELSGERMAVAVESGDQEDEHSCFSDNTHVDIIQNAQGIQNVLMGEYRRTNGAVVKGPGVINLLEKSLADSFMETSNKTMVDVYAIPVPFDQAILDSEGQALIQESITSLRKQGDLVVLAAKDLGIENVQVELE